MTPDQSGGLSAEEMADKSATALPDKEVVSILDLNADLDLAIDAAAPIDLGVAAIGAAGSRNAERATQLSSVAFIGAATVWALAGLPNGWGPRPSAGLVAFAAATSAMILTKFAATRPGASRRRGPRRRGSPSRCSENRPRRSVPRPRRSTQRPPPLSLRSRGPGL